jgi:hypothetical protein
MTETGNGVAQCEVNYNRKWKRGIKLLHRLHQHADAPGIYPITLIVRDDGRWAVVVVPGQVEELGS